MTYQIICVCGHRFFINEQQLSGHVNCPSCGRALLPVVTPTPNASNPPVPANVPPAAPPDSAPAPTSDQASAAVEPPPASPPVNEPAIAAFAEPTKRCPFCGEVILAIARKCKHCGEFLDRPVSEPLPPSAVAPSPSPANTLRPSVTPPAQTPAPIQSTDGPVFSLSVSQWDNFWKYLICLTVAIIVPAILVKFLPQYAAMGITATIVLVGFMAWFFYFATRNSRCIIWPTRIETEVGILAKELNSLELFRVTDVQLKQGFIERLLGIGTVRVTSNDPNTPELILYQIPKARPVYRYLQTQVPLAAKTRGAVYFEK